MIPTAFAGDSGTEIAGREARGIVELLFDSLLYPTIILLSAVALLVFLWGCFEYFMNATNDAERQRGARHMLFGAIGLVIMIAVWAVLTVSANTLGLGQQLDCARDPTTGDCADAFALPQYPAFPNGFDPN